ncbi:MAG: Eco57I restriction-modification methylase domain-containing protein, partial [Planctomycetes bacterium]|nr:Eco57I restriction-modification methylase domain-containing protein [Planctomycetota bacterium]
MRLRYEWVLKSFLDLHRMKNRRKPDCVDAFLRKIANRRTSLSKSLRLRTSAGNARECDSALERLIEGIVFLRLAEEQGVVPRGRLRAVLNESDAVDRLYELIERAAEHCRTGLFRFETEPLRLDADDRWLLQLIESVCAPDPSVLPDDILGQMYQQFLSHPERPSHGCGSSKAVGKKDARRESGVYYTPRYIVDYIVENTVGNCLNGKSPQAVGGLTPAGKPSPRRQPLTVLDPACGSGSFLIGAYRKLLHWHCNWYVDDGPDQHAERIARTAGGDWMLTVGERERILLTHIYGVDLDPRAVELARLSLLLMSSGEENGVACNASSDRETPDLSQNIKCGNALIEPDENGNGPAISKGAFDWQTEFASIMQAGGFDCVIGNPPYRRELGSKKLLDELAATAFGSKHRAARMDLWHYFLYRGLGLLQPEGVLSFIVNAYWTAGTGAGKLIAILKNSAHIDELFDLDALKIFKGVSGRHLILRISKQRTTETTTGKVAQPAGETSAEPFVAGTSRVNIFRKTELQLFRRGRIDLEPAADELLAKLGRHPPLETLGITRQGIVENPAFINRRLNERFGNRWQEGEGVFAVTDDELDRLNLSDHERSLIRPYHRACDLGRYFAADSPSRQLIYSTPRTCRCLGRIPNIRRHLQRFRAVLEARRET